MTQPTSKGEACAILVGEFGLDRPDAQRKLGANMTESLISDGLAIQSREGFIVATAAGRRCALAHRDPMKEDANG